MTTGIQAAAKQRLNGSMPDSSYPIKDQHSADSAWKLRGRSGNYSEAQIVNHVRERVQALGLKMPGGKS